MSMHDEFSALKAAILKYLDETLIIHQSKLVYLFYIYFLTGYEN